MDVRQILARVIASLGGEQALLGLRTLRTEGDVSVHDMHGTFHSVLDLAGIRERSLIDLAPLHNESGFDGSVAWSVDSNGKRALFGDPEKIEQAIAMHRFAMFHYLTHRDQYEFSLDASQEELVVDVRDRALQDRSYGHMRLVVDPVTFLPKRKDMVVNGERESILYREYREFDGVVYPTETVEIDAAGNQMLFRHTHVEMNPEIDPQIFAPPEEDVVDYRFLSGGRHAVIPVRIPHDHIYTDVEIAGGRYQFGVDTGAGVSVLAADLAEELGLKLLGTIHGQGVSGVQAVKLVRVPEVLVGDIALDNQQVVVIDFTELNKRLPEMRGILGMDFFNRFVVRLDYVRGEMEIFDRETFEYRGSGHKFPLDGINIVMSFDGHQDKFRIDTGAGGFALHTPFARRNGLLDRKDRLPSASGIAGVGSMELTTYSALCHTVSLGEFSFHDMPVSFAEIESGPFANEAIAGNVGNEIWRRFIVYFDFSASRVILEPNVNIDEAFRVGKFGMTFLVEQGRCLIDKIVSRSPAAELGLARSDELLDFDGQPAMSLSLEEIAAKFTAPAGTRYRLVFRTAAGEKKECDVTLQEYLRHYDEV